MYVDYLDVLEEMLGYESDLRLTAAESSCLATYWLCDYGKVLNPFNSHLQDIIEVPTT